MSTEQQDTVPLSQVTERIEEIFGAASTLKTKVVDLLVRNRPIGYSHRSNAPYYKKVYALQIKSILDKLVTSGKPQVFYWKDYCGEGKLSKTTLYLKVNSALRYLLDNLDTVDKQYKSLSERISIRRTSVGLVLALNGITHGDNLVAEEAVDIKDTPKWEQEMDKWLEETQVGDAPFHLSKLQLSPDEIRRIKLSLSQLTNVISLVTAFEIKLIKINPNNI